MNELLNFKRPKFNTYLLFLFLADIFLAILLGGMVYVAWHLGGKSQHTLTIFSTLSGIIILITTLPSFLMIVTYFFGISFPRPNKLYLYVYKILNPIVLLLSRILFLSQERLEYDFAAVNNSWVIASFNNDKPKNILFETPICTQWNECPHNVTGVVSNCKGCGKCQIKDLLELQKEFPVQLAVLTGGTRAKKLVKEIHPDLVIAICCEHELFEGVTAVAPMKVFGIVNDKPEGPCVNTRFNVNIAREALKFFS